MRECVWLKTNLHSFHQFRNESFFASFVCSPVCCCDCSPKPGLPAFVGYIGCCCNCCCCGCCVWPIIGCCPTAPTFPFPFAKLWESEDDPEHKNAKARNIRIINRPAKHVKILDNRKHHHFLSWRHIWLGVKVPFTLNHKIQFEFYRNVYLFHLVDQWKMSLLS